MTEQEQIKQYAKKEEIFKIFSAVGYLLDHIDEVMIYQLPKDMKNKYGQAKYRGNLLLKALDQFNKTLPPIEEILTMYQGGTKEDNDAVDTQLHRMSTDFDAVISGLNMLTCYKEKKHYDIFSRIIQYTFAEITQELDGNVKSKDLAIQNQIKILINMVDRELKNE